MTPRLHRLLAFAWRGCLVPVLCVLAASILVGAFLFWLDFMAAPALRAFVVACVWVLVVAVVGAHLWDIAEATWHAVCRDYPDREER